MTTSPALSIFDSPALLAFMATAYTTQHGPVTLYLTERRTAESHLVAPPDGRFKRVSDYVGDDGTRTVKEKL